MQKLTSDIFVDPRQVLDYIGVDLHLRITITEV